MGAASGHRHCDARSHAMSEGLGELLARILESIFDL